MLLDLWFHHTFVKPKVKEVISVSGDFLNIPLLLNRKIEEKPLKFNDDEDIISIAYALFAAKII